MEVLILGLGFTFFVVVGVIIAIVALVIAKRAASAVAAAQQVQPTAAPGGTIAIGDLLGQLIPAGGGSTVVVVEGVRLGRQHLNPDDDAITRDDHVVFHKATSASGTLVIAEILHQNGIEVGGRRFTSGRVQIADGANIKIGTTEFTFRKM